jgi:hypothetical protein
MFKKTQLLPGGKTMRFIKMRSLLLAVISGLAAVLISIGLLGLSPALAQERELSGPVRQAAPEQPPPDDDFVIIVVFTDPAKIQITDLSGKVIGEGEHGGEVRCNRNKCSQKTQLSFGVPLTDPTVYEYKFTTRQAIDPEAERAVVGGTGTISNRGQKERFSFTATFQNNKDDHNRNDGTVSVTYQASRPDASFMIPKSPGSFRIFRRR